jgi:hypothetical protein
MSEHLTSVLLNDNQTVEVPVPYDESVQETCEALVRTDGGKFQCQLGLIEVKIMSGSGSAVVAVKCNGVGIALSVVAWEPLLDEEIWKDLAAQHCRMMRRFGMMPEHVVQPKTLPWITISLAPSFVASAPAVNKRLALSALWSIASGILAHQRKAVVTN